MKQCQLQQRQCSCNITLRQTCITTTEIKKQYVLHLLSTCTILHCHLWPLQVYHIFPHNLINGTIFIKKSYWT
jgi:hypothetical protein